MFKNTKKIPITEKLTQRYYQRIAIKKQNPDDGHRGLLLTNYKPKL